MIELAVKLLVVTVVIVGGLLVAARATRGGRSGSGIRVMGRHGLSKTAVVAVLEIDGRRFLVGAGDQQVALLTELDPADEADDPDIVEVDTVVRPGTSVERVGAALASAHRHSRRPHWTGPSTTGPRIGPLDRLRAMTVRSHVERGPASLVAGQDGALGGVETPIHVQPPPS